MPCMRNHGVAAYVFDYSWSHRIFVSRSRLPKMAMARSRVWPHTLRACARFSGCLAEHPADGATDPARHDVDHDPAETRAVDILQLGVLQLRDGLAVQLQLLFHIYLVHDIPLHLVLERSE